MAVNCRLVDRYTELNKNIYTYKNIYHINILYTNDRRNFFSQLYKDMQIFARLYKYLKKLFINLRKPYIELEISQLLSHITVTTLIYIGNV